MGACEFTKVCMIPNKLRGVFGAYIKRICQTERAEECANNKALKRHGPLKKTPEWKAWMKRVREVSLC